ncbi:MAG TPA: hypothetical protein PK929_10425, partial [Quisquiliibacterium sp.]|nr:hypothetical protein [Quisquiliibacterium sp.]
MLGFRHGFDSDHVAAIDALARVQREAGRRRLARWCGAFFSGGHALVVLVAALLAVRVGEGAAPAWADAAGGWFSIACLAVFGVLNLHSAFARHRHGHLLGRALGLIRPVAEFGGETVTDRLLIRLRYGARLARETQLPVLISGGRPLRA